MSALRTTLTETARLKLSSRTTKRHQILFRPYATNNTTPSRRAVTVTNDDGRVNWTDLSRPEKAARTAQQSFNFLVVAAGMVMTGTVAVFLFTDVFSPNSKTAYFNSTVAIIKAHQGCVELLGEPKNMFAYGESPWSSFRRARVDGPTAMTKVEKDPRTGAEHLRMKFLIRGDKNDGWVTVHMAKPSGQRDFEYIVLAVDVKGHQRLYLENRAAGGTRDKSSGKILGIKWW
jgi:import inner membrane translocase subunit TIM21